MVINRSDMKRKRKDDCSSTLLDDSPKRTKVHAQRKFAQGSNVNSPVITPVKELEKQDIDVLPEPVELLPIKRPNTEDFLTFLCFRGTPILPPSLNFFNTASIVDTNGQVHEIKSESPKNGPIDTSAITKTGSGLSERPFVAFGVRKRADPIVISRQMDKKRRHALTIQALRRKYQEQRMAKIRAVTISKLSEKVTNKTLVRTNSVSKTETLTKKSTIQKTKVVAATKVTTRTTVKATLRPKIKPKMCLRSFRGRFVQRELQFRNVKKKILPEKKVINKIDEDNNTDNSNSSSEYSSDDDEPLMKTAKGPVKVAAPKVAKKSAPGPKKPIELNFRVTRSSKFLSNKLVTRRQQIKQRMILSAPKTVVKPRTLRSQTLQKSILSQKAKNLVEVKEKVLRLKNQKTTQKFFKENTVKKVVKTAETSKKEITTKKEINKSNENTKKDAMKAKSTENTNKKEAVKTLETTKKLESTKKEIQKKDGTKSVVMLKKLPSQTVENSGKKEEANADKVTKVDSAKVSPKTLKKTEENSSKKEPLNKNQSADTGKKDLTKKSEPQEPCNKKEETKKKISEQTIEPKTSQRPTRKTKEAAAIYMEILSHKLVNEDKIDDDNVSIDSFPELPNVKRTEQREIELKAKAKCTTKPVEVDGSSKNTKPKDNEVDNKKNSDEKKRSNIPKNNNKDKDEVIEKKDSVVVKKIQEKMVEELEKDIIEIVDSDDEVLIQDEKIGGEQSKKVVNSTVKATKEDDDKIKTKSTVKEQNVEKVATKEIDAKVQVILKKDCTVVDQSKVKKLPNKTETKEILGKRKSSERLTKNYESESDDSIILNKMRKSETSRSKKCSVSSVEITKRQTRNSSQINIKADNSDDSDESFFVDIKIPRKKPVTRSKNMKSYRSISDNEENDNGDEFLIWDEKSSKKTATRNSHKSYKEFSSTDSDNSTTSDVNVKKVLNVNKNKRFTKTKSQQKNDQSFSDSDEEPLSKLTQNKNKEVKDVNIIKKQKLEEETKKKEIETKYNKTKEKTDEEKSIIIETENVPKPKRECAKRPQNYLPMFSSSDEDDKCFHGFIMKSEKSSTKPTKTLDNNCTLHVPPSSDLLYKDIGRRFGKGKVNMSNEQIEKWLKDSAMAGNSIKKENDEMLKFGEKIPTETSLTLTNVIDTQKLKSSLLITNDEKHDEIDSDKSTISPESRSLVAAEKNLNKLNMPTKPVLIDRKLIFRKDKISTVPNKNAFSANNESSVYAFGEENEDVMKTPFRRITRRPSSTATSKSEDESSKYDESSKSGHFRKPTSVRQDLVKFIRDTDDSNNSLALQTNDISNNVESSQTETDDNNSHLFYTPLQPKLTVATSLNTKIKSVFDQKSDSSSSMIPPSIVTQKTKLNDSKNLSKQNARNFDRFSETSEEFKYKVPSSPSASSSSSAKLYKRQNSKPKFRPNEIHTEKLFEFPSNCNQAQLVEAPTFYPTDKEFQDPIEYIEKIRHKAEQFGICRIVPPSTFKPECKVTDDMRFTAYNQYVHKMLHRWGPNFKELMAIKKYLSTQNISLTHPPWIGGMEVDLPRLYQTVQSLGGLKEVIEKKKWPKVSDAMKIPKFAQDRVTKLDDIYCKYLLPYDTLSLDEREKLFDEVETEWAKRESKTLLKVQQNLDDNNSNDAESESYDEAEECIVKGRNIALNAFYRIARNTMSMWFKSAEPPAEEVEQEFWKHVTLRQNHICVHSGSIDSGNWGYGFAVSKNSPFARHAWNLKVLTNNSGSVLRSLGPIMGVTVPTLHVGMVFSACCWYRDPHTLPWIEYLHTGGNKIWYGIPDSNSRLFQLALKKLVPNYCQNKTLWLPSDTAMVPPNLLIKNGVSLCRLVQEPGQFVVVFPKVFTSSLSTGYVVSESVYFAPPRWLNTAKEVFDDLRSCCESSMFSLDRLLLSIVADARSSIEVLRQIIPSVKELCDKEIKLRSEIKTLGVTVLEKLPLPEAPTARKRKKLQKEDGDYECKVCRMNLFVSMITESQEDVIYCLHHAAEEIEKKTIQSKNCKFMYTYDDQELNEMINKINSIIEYKLQKKIPNKYTGMPTLLTK